MERRIGKREWVSDCARPMSVGVTLAEMLLVEAVNFGDATVQISAMAFATLSRILTIGSAVSGQPVGRMCSGTVYCRGLIIDLAASRQSQGQEDQQKKQ
jgi:hypothetical protein